MGGCVSKQKVVVPQNPPDYSGSGEKQYKEPITQEVRPAAKKVDNDHNGTSYAVNGKSRGLYVPDHSSVHPQGYMSMATEQPSVGGSFIHPAAAGMKHSAGYRNNSTGFDLSTNGQVMTRAERRVSNMQLLRRDSMRLTRTSSFQAGSTPPGGKAKQHRMAFDQAKLQESLLTDAANLHKAFAELARTMQEAHERAERLVRTAVPMQLEEDELESFFQGLRKCVVFSGIHKEDVPAVCGLMVQESLPAGVSLMRQDDRVDDNGRMYLIREGSCGIYAQGDEGEIRRRAGDATTPTTSYGIKVGTIQRHHVFGDYAIVTDTARSATVVTAENTVVLSLTKTLALALGFKFSTRMRVLKHLLSLPLFNSVSTPVLFDLLETIEVDTLPAGEEVNPIGSPFLYLVMKGVMSAGSVASGMPGEDSRHVSEGSGYGGYVGGDFYRRSSAGAGARLTLKPGSVLGPGPFGTQDTVYDVFTTMEEVTLIKFPRDRLYRLLPPLSALMLDYEVLLNVLEIPGIQTACRKVKDILGSVSVERYEAGAIIREKSDMVEELILLRCGEIETCSTSNETMSEEELATAFKNTTYRLPSGMVYLGQWSQFEVKNKVFPCSIRATSQVIVVTVKHTTLRRLAERYLMDDVSSSHANLLAAMRMVLHQSLHEFLTPVRLGEVLAVMKPFFESRGGKLCERDKPIAELRILISGAAQIVFDGDIRPKLLCQFEAVGTEYLEGSRTYKNDAVVTSETVEGLSIAWADLEKLAGNSLLGIANGGVVTPLDEPEAIVNGRDSVPFSDVSSTATQKTYTPISSIFDIGKNTEQIDLADIQVRVLLGYGFAGEVYLVHDNRTAKPAALKVIRKERLTDVKMVEHVINEINILMLINSPMVCRLYGTYQDAEALYLFMEFISGPEMMMVLETVDRFTYDQARFYIANVLLGLQALHAQGVAHRDIKPENIVFDEYGYAKIVDMGLAKKIKMGQKAWTVCGTPAYQAPEVHTGQGCTTLVDVWCVGVLAYELLTGTNPFGVVDSPDIWWKTIQKIESGRFVIPVAQQDAHDFIRSCLAVNPERRPSIDQLIQHSWFKGLDFDKLITREIIAPFSPNRENFGSGPWDALYLNPDGTRPEPALSEGEDMYLEEVY